MRHPRLLLVALAGVIVLASGCDASREPEPSTSESATGTSTQASTAAPTGPGLTIVASWLSDDNGSWDAGEESLASAVTVVLPTDQHRDDWLAGHGIADGPVADITAVDFATSFLVVIASTGVCQASDAMLVAGLVDRRPALWTERPRGSMPSRAPSAACSGSAVDLWAVPLTAVDGEPPEHVGPGPDRPGGAACRLLHRVC